MGILDRVSMLVRSNINDLLDRAENPEKALDQVIRDMASAINQAKAQVAETIAQKNLIEEDLNDDRKLAEEWRRKAELAVRRNADDLAREALRRHKDYLANAEVYQHQLTSQQEVVDKLKGQLLQLQNKYDDIVRNRNVLISRHRTAKATQKVLKTAAAMSGMDPTSELGRMEEKIRMEEARAKAAGEIADTSIDARFRELEAGDDPDIEDELAALKEKVGQPALGSGDKSQS